MEEKAQNEESRTLRFTYKRGLQYRVIKTDGIWGNMTPRGDIIMSVFVERPAVPDFEEYKLDEIGPGTFDLKASRSQTETDGLIREIEVALALRPEVALSVGKWLLKRVKDFEAATGIELEPKEDGNQSEQGK